MSRRHLIDRRLEVLADIRGIMDSIKTLSFMETQRLAPVLPVQQQCLQRVRRMASDFAAEHTLPPLNGAAENPLLIVIGAERGLCGDFNKQLASELERLSGNGPPREFVCLGTRLGQKLEARPGLVATLPGASIAEDVPGVIRQLLERCAALQSERRWPTLALLYHVAGTDAITLDPLLSPFFEKGGTLPRGPLLLNLEPQVFLHSLLQQYLYTVLLHACYSSLLAENRKRMAHLESAVMHLDEECERLAHKRNRLYQEDIIAELEIILVADQSTGEFVRR